MVFGGIANERIQLNEDTFWSVGEFLVKRLFSNHITPNFFDTYPPFQIDGNFGITAGIAEMLLQSHERDETGDPIIRLLPALLKAWPTGKVTGLRARGAYEVDMRWKDGRLAGARTQSDRGGSLTICYGKTARILKLKPGEELTLPEDWLR